MNEKFRNNEITKTYWAIVPPGINPPTATLTHWLKRNTKMNKSFAHDIEVNDSKKAILHYKRLRDLDRYAVLEIVLETGRHHQIRSQLTHVGFPIKGDLKYGAKRSNPQAIKILVLQIVNKVSVIVMVYFFMSPNSINLCFKKAPAVMS